MRPSRLHLLEAALLGAGVFAVYAAGACRTIYVGDSGELVAAVHLLGIPHPSGYPLYVLLGKLWTLLVPIGSVALRMSLFSAAAGAATGATLYWTARRADSCGRRPIDRSGDRERSLRATLMRRRCRTAGWRSPSCCPRVNRPWRRGPNLVGTLKATDAPLPVFGRGTMILPRSQALRPVCAPGPSVTTGFLGE